MRFSSEMKTLLTHIAIPLCLILATSTSFGQNSVELKKKQEKLQKQIQQTKSLLGQTEASSVSELNQLKIIDKQVGYRQRLISNITLQLKNIEFQIRDHRKNIKVLEARVEQIREHYHEMLRKAYRSQHKYSGLAYVFSAKSFHGAYSRVRYMEQMNEYRRKQKVLLEQSKTELQTEIQALEGKIYEKRSLLGEREKEKEEFIQTKQQRREALQKLENQKAELQEKLRMDIQKDKEIQTQIDRAIKKEAEAAAAKLRNSTEKERKEITLSSKGFASNKGKLPWPVSTHEVTKKFGKTVEGPYAFESNNTGIDIATSLGAQVNCVYDGEVVIVMPSANGQIVMVAHGSYRTLYAKLSEVYVKKGDKLKSGQAIGSLLPSGKNMSELHFEVILLQSGGKFQHQNPSYWLRR